MATTGCAGKLHVLLLAFRVFTYIKLRVNFFLVFILFQFTESMAHL